MKLITFAALMISPLLAQAHCPIEINWNGQAYCTDIEWQYGDKKVSGVFKASDIPSPYLIPMGEIPQKWVYSKAEFKFWKKGDHSHTPQTIDGLRIFPFMLMENGHSHSSSYQFVLNPTTHLYTLFALGMQEMAGCWSLRWTTADSDDLATSSQLSNVVAFTNLDEAKKQVMAEYCKVTGVETPGEDHEHHH